MKQTKSRNGQPETLCSPLILRLTPTRHKTLKKLAYDRRSTVNALIREGIELVLGKAK